MKKLVVFFLPVLLMSCDFVGYRRGNGHMITRTFNVSDFDEIQLTGDYKVNLIPGTSEEVEIEADENLMEDIDVDVIGSNLRIESRRIRSRKGITLNIYYKELNGISAGGAIDLMSRATIRSKYFDIRMGGAGEIDLEFEGEKLTIKMSGAGDIRLSGKATELDINISGAGGLDAFDLKTDFARVRISGIGGADVYVSRELEARISGLGDINYKGSPKYVDSDVSGLGSINEVRSSRTE